MVSPPVKIAATLACRNAGSRLYAKPLQRLGDKTILQHMIDQLRHLGSHGSSQMPRSYELEIVLGISEGIENLIYQEIAQENKIGFIIGSQHDVQFRLLQCAHLAKAEVILRITTESPFTAWEYFPVVYRTFVEEKLDLVTIRNLPDGGSFALVRYQALREAHDRGDEQTRTELCTKYLFDHPDQFRLKILDPKPEHDRYHYRLTVDHPDDLVVCRKIFSALSQRGEFPEFGTVIRFLDEHPELMQQLQWIDGTLGRLV